MKNALLDVCHLGWTYKDTPILHDIDFSLKTGQRLAIIGPNGAGKSSLLKCLCAFHQHTQGEVFVKGKALHQLSATSRARHIAVLTQQPQEGFELSLKQVVQMGFLPHKGLFARHTTQDESRLLHAIDTVGLRGKLSHTFNSLSGGEQQRGLIARALVQQSPLLLLDEPTNHLDVYYQHQVLMLLEQLKLSVVVSLHDINLAARYCDLVLLLHEGRQLAFGTPQQVLSAPLLSDVFNLPCRVESSPDFNIPQVTFIPEGGLLASGV